MILATVAGMIGDMLLIIIWAVILSLATLIALSYKTWIRLHPAGGYANYVTFGRFILLLFALSMHHALSAPVFVILIIAVMIADGVDGYLARRWKQSTDFGEVFDMEVDAFLALSVAFLIWTSHQAAYWLIVAGALRYIFVVMYWCMGWHHRRRPEMRDAKLIAVVFFLSLLTPFNMKWDYAQWIVAAGSLLVTASFLREFYLVSKISKM
jgi:phosphatidylglycerophosphate synthase